MELELEMELLQVYVDRMKGMSTVLSESKLKFDFIAMTYTQSLLNDYALEGTEVARCTFKYERGTPRSLLAKELTQFLSELKDEFTSKLGGKVHPTRVNFSRVILEVKI